MRSILLRRHSRWASAAFGTKEELLAQHSSGKSWLRGLDLNQRPSGYEPDELPGCSTPRFIDSLDLDFAQSKNRAASSESRLLLAATATSLMRGRKNSGWHGELVGSRVCRALVSEEDAGWRTPRLVRTALRSGRSELHVLFRAGTATCRALVCCDAG